MSTRSIGVFGYGTIGKPVALALAERGANVLIFSRDASKLKDIPTNAKVFTVDYSDGVAVAKILREHAVDAVVSTLNIGTLDSLQIDVARAAKEAGVKLFVPSEYGFNSAGYTDGSRFTAKEANAASIKALGLPTTRVMTGLFAEVVSWLTADRSDPTSGKFVIAGKGEEKFTITSVSDIAGFIAYILTALPLSDLNDRVLLLEGQALSLNEIAALYGKEVKYVSLDSLEVDVGDSSDSVEPDAVLALLSFTIDAGRGRTGFSITAPDASEEVVNQKSGSANGLWPGHKWQQLKEAIPSI